MSSSLKENDRTATKAVMATQSLPHDSQLARAVEKYLVALETGEPLDRAELLSRHPEIAEELGKCLEGLDLVHRVGPQLGSSDRSPVFAAGAPATPETTLGDYRIVREIGRGGMGVVYEAEQISLGRRVALKVLPFAAILDQRQIQRFQNEARAAATLDHPNIVSIYSVSCERGVHFFAMQFIEGQSLAEVIDELRRDQEADPQETGEPGSQLDQLTEDVAAGRRGSNHSQAAKETLKNRDDETDRVSFYDSSLGSVANRDVLHTRDYFHRVAEFGMQAAEALDHAHSLGIVHRDVKPGNLMLDAAGKIWITDFGLARIEADPGMTMTGDILGTLRYMSPEQAHAKLAVVDHRTDIYSLGVTLYELLTLKPVFKGKDHAELLKQIALDEPLPPCRINRRVPHDLGTIVQKAIQKSPQDRYDSAQEMADDLRSFLADEPIRARRPTLIDRTNKWSRRHTGIVWTAVSFATLLALVSLVGTVLLAQSREEAYQQGEVAKAERQDAFDQRNVAIAERNVARRNQYFADIVSGQNQLNEGNFGQLHAKLIEHLPSDGDTDHRGWEWYYLMSRCHSERRTLHHAALDPDISWSPDGKFISAAGVIWGAESGECLRNFCTGLVTRNTAWSPDSKLFAWGAGDGLVVWNPDADLPSRQPIGNSNPLAWNPEGTQIACRGNALGNRQRDAVLIWDIAAQSVVATIDRKIDERWQSAHAVAWSPDGELLAIVWSDYGLTIGSPAGGAERKEIRIDLPQRPEKLCWHPNGQQLAFCTSQAWYVLAREGWSTLHEHEFASSGNHDIAWRPDGKRLAIAHGEVVSIWDPAAEQPESTIVGHLSPIRSIAWSPDSTQLAAYDTSGDIRIWDVNSLPAPLTISSNHAFQSLQWRPDNATLLTISAEDASITYWNALDGTRIKTVPSTAGPDSCISPSRDLVAVHARSADKSTITVSNTNSGAVHSVWKAQGKQTPNRFSWSADGSRLAIQLEQGIHWWNEEQHVEFWDVDREQTISRWKNRTRGDGMELISWSSDGSRIAAAAHGDWDDDAGNGSFPRIHIVDVAHGKRILRYTPEAPIKAGSTTALAWSPNDNAIASGDSQGVVYIRRLDSKAQSFRLKPQKSSIAAIAWSPDGRRVISAAENGTIAVFATDAGEDLLTLSVSEGGVSHVAWSDDGRRLAAATDRGSIYVWDATKGFELARDPTRRGEMARMHFNSRRHDLREVIRLAPDRLGFWRLRGKSLAELGQFGKSVEEFNKIIRADLEHSIRARVLYRPMAMLGDRDIDGYRSACISLLDRGYGNYPSARIAWLCTLVPDVVANTTRLVEMSRANNITPGSHRTRGTVTAGACLYRDGQYEDASRVLADVVARLKDEGGSADRYYCACAQFFLAMSRQQLGHNIQARRILADAQKTPRGFEGQSDQWRNRVVLETLGREAVSLIRD